MTTLEQVTDWLDGYIRAWNTNESEDIGLLFTDDAAYYTEPFRVPWRGRAAIVANWLARKDEPGQSRFTWAPLAITDEVAIVQGQAKYANPPRIYWNLWVIRLDADCRCSEFIEWWMEDTTDLGRQALETPPGRRD